MNIKKLISTGLKKNPIVAEAIPDNGVAILYTVRDEVLCLKIDMAGKEFERICEHVWNGVEPKMVRSIE